MHIIVFCHGQGFAIQFYIPYVKRLSTLALNKQELKIYFKYEVIIIIIIINSYYITEILSV